MNQQDYILCVDDDEDDCLLLEEAIKKTGKKMALKFLHSGEEAIAFLRSTQEGARLPKMIILDINMPKINGTELLTEIRDTLNINVPVLLFTTRPRDQDILMGERYNASLLVKPNNLRSYDAIVATIFHSLLN